MSVELPDSGTRVRDRDDESVELLVVDTHPETTAADHVVEEIGATVADVNPEYDPGAAVVDAVYLDELDETLDTWRGVEDVRDAVAFGAVSAYSFPADRLAGGEA
jgi:hypothetical protein